MRQSTTPTLTMKLKDFSGDLTQAAHVYFALRQAGLVIKKKDEDLEISADTVAVFLPQEDTVKLAVGRAKVQLNWTYPPDNTGRVVRPCSAVAWIEITENLQNEVLA